MTKRYCDRCEKEMGKRLESAFIVDDDYAVEVKPGKNIGTVTEPAWDFATADICQDCIKDIVKDGTVQ